MDERNERKVGDDWDEQERLIRQLMAKTAELQRKMQSEDDEEHRWMIARCRLPAAKEAIKGMSVLMLEIVDAVGKLEPVNGITISKRFGIPKGSVSKLTRKLAEKQIVQSQLLPDNKKEIYFSLTEIGREIYSVHEEMHRQLEAGVASFLRRYSNEELRFLNGCMQDTIEASWMAPEAPAERKPKAAAAQGELDELAELLRRLSPADLRKAKAVLRAVFPAEDGV